MKNESFLRYFIDRIIHFPKLSMSETSNARPVLLVFNIFSDVAYDRKGEVYSSTNTFLVGNDCRRIGSPWDATDYANRSVTVKLHPLRDVNVRLSTLGESRARADYEIDRCPRLFC